MDRLFGGRIVLRVVAAGAVIGAVCYVFPDLLFSGENQIQDFTANPALYGAGLLLLLAFLKIGLFGISIKAGYIGGPVFPIIFACTLIGLALNLLIPGVPAAVFVLCIEAGALAVAMGVPLTAILLVALLSGADQDMVVLLVFSIATGLLLSAEAMKRIAARRPKESGATVGTRYEPRHEHRDIEHADDGLGVGKGLRERRDGGDVPVAHGGERDEAVVDEVHPVERAGGGDRGAHVERGRVHNGEALVEQGPGHAQEQVDREGSRDDVARDLVGRDHGPEQEDDEECKERYGNQDADQGRRSDGRRMAASRAIRMGVPRRIAMPRSSRSCCIASRPEMITSETAIPNSGSSSSRRRPQARRRAAGAGRPAGSGTGTDVGPGQTDSTSATRSFMAIAKGGRFRSYIRLLPRSLRGCSHLVIWSTAAVIVSRSASFSPGRTATP